MLDWLLWLSDNRLCWLYSVGINFRQLLPYQYVQIGYELFRYGQLQIFNPLQKLLLR